MKAPSISAWIPRRWVQRPEWLSAFVVAFVLLALIDLTVRWVSAPGAGSPWGVSCGSLASLLMVAAALLGVRRRTIPRAFGRTQTWVQIHVYGGTLSLLLVLMHAGFRWPAGTLERWLLALSLWVAGSGLVGVILRKWLPRVLASGLTTEALYERIPDLAASLRQRGEELTRAAPDPVRDLYRRRLAPLLARPRVRWIYFVDPSGGIANRLREIDYLRERLSLAERERVDELRALVRTKLELDAHLTLQRPLRWWLYLHVPPSLLLLVLVAVHLVTVLYY